MTTVHVHEHQELADALTIVIERLGADREAVAAVAELRSAATPKNAFHTAFVPYGAVRGRIALALRAVAADGGPVASMLEGIAAMLAPGTAPEPAPEPAAPPPAPLPAA